MTFNFHILGLIVALCMFNATEAGTGDQEYSVKHMNKEIADKLRQAVAEHLDVGDDRDAIEDFLGSQGVEFSFDRFMNRYQGIIRDVADRPEIDQAVVVHVYVDDDRRFLRAEVYDSFTGHIEIEK